MLLHFFSKSLDIDHFYKTCGMKMIFALVNDMNAQTLGLIHRIGFNTSCSEYSQHSHMEILLDVALFYASIFWLTFLVPKLL